VCGIKNFVSVRLYSAPQSHWTIVSILGICADGGVDQTEIDRHIQRSLLPPGQRRPGSLPGGRRSVRQLCVIPGRRHQCAHRRMGRMRGAYPTPEIPRTRVSDSHTDGRVKSSVGDTFIPTKSATPAMPHTYLARRAVRREGFLDAGAVGAAARRDRSRDIREARSR